MAKLIYSLDGAFIGEFPLDKGRLSIGRRVTNDIHIDNLAVSGEHAAITTIGKESFLEDLDSTNGTFVNGKAVKKHLLKHGDVIELGKYQLKFVNEPKAQGAHGSGQAEAGRIQSAPPADVPATPAAAPPAPAAAEPPAEFPLAHLQLLTGTSAGKELVLSKALTTLGKAGSQVAVISRRPGGYFITHVEGESHPVVNGTSVGGQAYPLNDHDVIEIAGVKMEFFLVSA